METHTRPAARPLKAICRLVASLIVAGTPLMAQEAGWSKYNYGVQAGMLMPMGDFTTFASTGFGLGGYMEKVWSNSWALRGRLEYAQFGEKSYGSLGVKIEQTGLMSDVIYYMNHKDTIYPFAGIGYYYRSESISYKDSWGYDSSLDAGEPAIAFCVGAGWNFTPHLGAEVKYTITRYGWLQLSVLYRF